MITKFPALLCALFLTLTLAACGGGSQNLTTNDINGGQNPPTGGNPTPVGNLSVALSWTPPTTYIDTTQLNDLAGTNIYMKAGNGDYVLIGTVTASEVTYSAHNLSAGTSYTFTVTAFNTQGVESAFSSPVTIQL